MDGSANGHAPAVGDTCVTTRRIGGANRPSTSTLTHFDPPRTWGVQGIDGPIRAVVDVQVEPLGDTRSRLTITGRVIPRRRQHGPGVYHARGAAEQVDAAELGDRRGGARVQRLPIRDVDRARPGARPGILALPRSGLNCGGVPVQQCQQCALARQSTPADVAEAINAEAGERVVSGTYLWLLRTGQRDNPTMKHIIAIARFFGVPPTYFFPDDTMQHAVPADLAAALSDDKVREMALRAAGLSDRSLKAITDMIHNARTVEGLPDDVSPAD